MSWNNRIVGHEEVDPTTLNMNKLNWRVHTDEQRRALSAVLDSVGFVRSILVSKRTNNILDGHLRVTLAIAEGEETVPVELVDVNEAEEAEILATLDPLSAMAGTDQALLHELMLQFEVDSYDLQAMLDANLNGYVPVDEETLKAPKTQSSLPEMELRPYEHYDYVLVLATSTTEWMALCEKLGLERTKMTRPNGKTKIGLGRAIHAKRLLDLLP